MSDGRCGDDCPTNGETWGLPFEWCALPAGHAGWHKSDRGTEWYRVTPAPPPAAAHTDTGHTAHDERKLA